MIDGPKFIVHGKYAASWMDQLDGNDTTDTQKTGEKHSAGVVFSQVIEFGGREV